MSRRQVKVEILDVTPEEVLSQLGIRGGLITAFMSLDIWIDPSSAVDESFWGVLQSELGRLGLNQEVLRRRNASPDRPASIFLLDESRLSDLVLAFSSTVSHWMEASRRNAPIDLDAYLRKDRGMERLSVRGSIMDALDAMRAWKSGLVSTR